MLWTEPYERHYDQAMASTPPADSAAAAALAHWRRRAVPRLSPDNGLINRTWLVGEPPEAVLQWVNPIFHPGIHLDMEAVTRHLEESGFLTPRLLPAADGRLWVDGEPGYWRLLTYVPGRTIHRVRNPGQAAAAGGLVGRFHAALAGWSRPFHSPRRSIHDTPARMAELRAAVAGCDGHPLAAEVRVLAEEALGRWADWDGELDLPERICHGDLKISNVRFDAAGEKALCLIDFDTLEPMPFAAELGDAFRSWCNPADEAAPELARLDLAVFEAAARSWLAAAPPLAEREIASLVPGLERVVLELAARFLADAVRNSYFREDRERYPEPGLHNLVRARGQVQLARSVRAQRAACEAIVKDAVR
jgi:Ser/Thr protein kinase RdoA (MazF antagonist)